MLKKFLILLIILILITPDNAFALLNQEVTQLAILQAEENEIDQLKKMIEHQEKMIKKLDDSKFNDIKSKHDELIKNFEESYKILQVANTITHMVDDFDNKFKDRHPEYTSGLKIKDLKSRSDDRETKWRYTMKYYIQSVNWLIRDYKLDDANREKIIDLSKSPEGQTQALQSLHAMLDHASVILMRNENVVHGLLTFYLEREYDKIDDSVDKSNSIIEAYNKSRSYKPRVTARKMGM